MAGIRGRGWGEPAQWRRLGRGFPMILAAPCLPLAGCLGDKTAFLDL